MKLAFAFQNSPDNSFTSKQFSFYVIAAENVVALTHRPLLQVNSTLMQCLNWTPSGRDGQDDLFKQN